MNGTLHFFAGESCNHPLDLPPMAEAHDVPFVAAALRARRRLEPSVISITLDQIGRVGKREATMDEKAFHARVLNPRLVSRLPTNSVNNLLTMLGLPSSLWLA